MNDWVVRWKASSQSDSKTGWTNLHSSDLQLVWVVWWRRISRAQLIQAKNKFLLLYIRIFPISHAHNLDNKSTTWFTTVAISHVFILGIEILDNTCTSFCRYNCNVVKLQSLHLMLFWFASFFFCTFRLYSSYTLCHRLQGCKRSLIDFFICHINEKRWNLQLRMTCKIVKIVHKPLERI